jgi:Kef-type K+ transport system membrane component KefB
MNFTIFFGLLGGLLVLAFLANRLSKWTRVPDVIGLLATGIVVAASLAPRPAEPVARYTKFECRQYGPRFFVLL